MDMVDTERVTAADLVEDTAATVVERVMAVVP